MGLLLLHDQEINKTAEADVGLIFPTYNLRKINPKNLKECLSQLFSAFNPFYACLGPQ